MNINRIKKVDNYNDAREKSPFSSNIFSRSASVKSKAFSIPYYKRMVIQNDFPNEGFREPINCSQLLYNNNY